MTAFKKLTYNYKNYPSKGSKKFLLLTFNFTSYFLIVNNLHADNGRIISK